MRGLFARKYRFDAKRINHGVLVILFIISVIFFVSLVNGLLDNKKLTHNPKIEKAYP